MKYGEIVKSELPSEETDTDALTDVELDASGLILLDRLGKLETLTPAEAVPVFDTEGEPDIVA